MKYANERNAQNVLMIGSTELENEQITIKFMESGEQKTMTIDEFLSQL